MILLYYDLIIFVCTVKTQSGEIVELGDETSRLSTEKAGVSDPAIMSLQGNSTVSKSDKFFENLKNQN